MNSVYITGIAGLLGSNMAYLLRDKYRVSGMDLNEFKMQKVNSSSFSALDIHRIKEELIENQVDTFLHCAAMIDSGECEAHPEKAYKINYELTKDLVKVCEELGIKFIFISTDCVFDGKDAGLYLETDPANPVSVYGKTKLEAEKEVLKNERNLVARTTIYGFNYLDKVSFGEWILNYLASNSELNMFYDVYFSPILVNELTLVIDHCIQYGLSGLYHICGSGQISKYEMAEAIKKEFHLEGRINKVSIDDQPSQISRIKYRGLCNEKIHKELGQSIRTPLEGIREFKRLYDSGYTNKLRMDRLQDKVVSEEGQE